VQALSARELLTRFHYLSTVSGGGYMGTALTWLRYQYGDKFEEQLGARNQGDRTAQGADKTWLDYARMHGNYLKPPRIGMLSLVGVALRSLLFTVLVYGGAAAALLAVLTNGGVLPRWCDPSSNDGVWYGIQQWAVLCGCGFALQVLLYGVATWLTRAFTSPLQTTSA